MGSAQRRPTAEIRALRRRGPDACGSRERRCRPDDRVLTSDLCRSASRVSVCVFQIVARVSVDNRTRALVQALQRASDVRLCVRRVEELSLHLLEFPETRSVAVKVRKHFLLDQLTAQSL